MPRFEPFPGLRYSPDLAPLGEVIAPPYDVVDDAERAVLAARSPYNAIHVELPLEDPEHGLDRYAHAAELFEAWQRDGALVEDGEPCFYLYRMSFTDENGSARSTTGVIGALGIDAAKEGSVLPHERTMPKPKGDRLDLLRACRINTSPIWGLSLSEGFDEVCRRAVGGRSAEHSATDDEGTRHELWAVSDQGLCAELTALVAATPVVVADGHHRYETAGYYREEQREANGDLPGDYDLVMALIVALTPDELFVQAIHRLVSGLPAGFALEEALAESFDVRPGPSDPGELQKAMTTVGGIGLVTKKANALLVPLPETEERAEAPLDSSRLDVALAKLPPHDLVYQHGVRLAAGAVVSGEAEAAFLLRPATVAQIADTAHSGRRMPPKTTFFQPKPRTGMVFRPLAH